MQKIAVIFGTRPEAIKLAPVVLELQRQPQVECHVCVTGQHREMLDQMLKVFDIRPSADLQLMRPGQSLAELTARAVESLDRYLAAERPSLVVVQGDTTTVLCAALAAFYQRIPVAHVEAGLRTGDLQSPWPEEANRVITSRLAALHFAPTNTARDNLLREGIVGTRIWVTGNSVIDALLLAKHRVELQPPIITGFSREVFDGPAPLVLITGHRRENAGAGLESICRAIRILAGDLPQVHFVYPVHLSPSVREPVNRILGSRPPKNIHLIEPMPYLPFVALMARSTLILTDSGGIQEEAPSLGKPVLVLRDTTERPEAVAAGTVRLVGTSCEHIVAAVRHLLLDPDAYRLMARAHNPYGDGKAAARIVKACLASLDKGLQSLDARPRTNS